jgi:hypothetical protein
MGALSPNEIRAKENMNPVEKGDDHYIPLNFIVMGEDRAEPMLTEPEPEEVEDRAAKQERSATARKRLVDQYQPLFLKAANTIVNRECIAIEKQVKKVRSLRLRVEDFESWLADFYRDMPDHVSREMLPVVWAFFDGLMYEIEREMGSKLSKEVMDGFKKDYVDAYTMRHIGSSEGQLRKIIRETEPEQVVAALTTRLTEWREKRAKKIAFNEATRGNNALFYKTSSDFGIRMMWQAVGKSCPYCEAMTGRIIGPNQVFLESGEVLYSDVETDEETGKTVAYGMKINGSKGHPPLHEGCDCVLVSA